MITEGSTDNTGIHDTMTNVLSNNEISVVHMNELLNSSSIDLIIYDKDGTIVVAEEYHFRAWAYAYEQVGLTLTLEDYKAKGLAIKPAVFMNAMYPGQTQEQYDAILTQKEAEFQRIVEKEGIKPIEGFIEMFIRLQKPDRKMAVASSDSKEAIIDNLTRIGLLTEMEDPFAAIVSVKDKEVEHGKPAPDIFLVAMQRSGISDPSRVVVFEDAVSGVQAAKAANMICIARVSKFFSAEELKAAGADLVIDEYDVILPE